MNRRLRALLVDKALTADIARGKVVVSVQQFCRRKRPLAVPFEELSGRIKISPVSYLSVVG
jgi:hypothetical protein